MWISNRSPGWFRAQILSCPQFWAAPSSLPHTEKFAFAELSLLLPLIQKALWWCRPTRFSNYCLQMQVTHQGTDLWRAESISWAHRVEPIMNRDLIGKYLCTCTFLKDCIQFALQRECWKSAAYPLFIPIRGYYYPFEPESLASVQIGFSWGNWRLNCVQTG